MKINKTRIALIIGVIGSGLCLLSDILLGYFEPLKSEGIFLLFPNFSIQWKNGSGVRFIIGDALGVISLLLIYIGLFGISNLVLERRRQLFRIFSTLFFGGGIFYHSIFAMTAYNYNKLINANVENAMDIVKKSFISFIPIALFAVIGFIGICAIIAISIFKSTDGKQKLLTLVNPLSLMLLFALLSKVLPQNKFVSGFFGWGQHSIAFIISYVIALLYDKKIYSYN